MASDAVRHAPGDECLSGGFLWPGLGTLMPRRDFSRKVKAAAKARAAGRCDKCKAALKKGEGDVDHILPDILGGEPILANAQVLCRPCHAEKTADDIRRTRKADRARDKASGAIRPSSALRGRSREEKIAARDARAVTKLPLPPRQLFSSGLWPAGSRDSD
jgi:5-methylcytosine-specific restriction protein A